MDRELIIVYGKIRSGTSLCMKIIEHSGYRIGNNIKGNEERGAYGEITAFFNSGKYEPNKILIRYLEDKQIEAVKICSNIVEWTEYFIKKGYKLRGIGIKRNEKDRKKSVENVNGGFGTYKETKETKEINFEEQIGIQFEKLIKYDNKTIRGLAEFLNTTEEKIKEPIKPKTPKFS